VRDDAAAIAAADGMQRAAVTAFGVEGEEELVTPDLHPARRKVPETLGNYWTGLTVFVEHPRCQWTTTRRSDRHAGR
jgi:hypothetical protein